MRNSRKILLMLLMLALVVCGFAVTSFAADEAGSGESGSTAAPAYQSYDFPADKPAADYPLAVFEDKGNDTYTLVNLYTNWTEAIKAAYAKAKSVIYFRSDVTTGDADNKNDVYINGHTTSITIDLNGKTLYRKNAAYLIQALNQAPKTDVDVTFKNGTLVNTSTSWRGFFQYSYDAKHTVQDAYVDYTFDNVTVNDQRADSVADKDLIFSYSGSGGTKQTYGSVVFNDCKIYPASKNVRSIFDGQSNSSIDMAFIVNGGKIETSLDITLDKYISTTNGDVLIFGQSENGYTQFVYTNEAKSSGTIAVADETGVKRVLGNESVDGTTTTYELIPSTNETITTEETKYGNIGLTSTQTDWPLAVFVNIGGGYACVGVYNTWNGAAGAALGYANAVVYFRTDFEDNTSINLDGKQSSVIVDLNGKTFTRADKYFFDIYLNATVTNTTLTFENGTMVQGKNAGNRGFVGYNYGTGHTKADATMNFKFETVTFEDERTSDCANFIITVNENGKGAANIKQTKGTITFNNCTISPRKNASYIFNAYDSGCNVDLTYKVNGGKIIGTTDITLKDKLIRKNNDDSVTFGNYNGQYTEFVYPNSVTISNTISVTDDFGNTRVLAKKSNDDTNTTYELAEKTPYGLLTGLTAEQTTDKAQIALFEDKGSGNYTLLGVYAGADWNEAFKAAYAKSKAVIYFRANVTPNNDNDIFINNRTTSILVDLNGKTLYKKNAAYLIQMLNKDKAVTDVDVTFKNGTLVHQSTSWRGFFQFAAETTHTKQDASADYTFDNVKFVDERTAGYASGYNNFIFSIAGAAANDGMKDTNINAVFKNCELKPAKNVKNLFDFNNNSKLNASVVINGGKIVSSIDLTKTAIFNGNAGVDTITFGQGANGYTTVELASGKTMDTASIWNAEGAECVFVNIPGTTTYKLYPTVMQGYTIKTSVTLYSNFVYNIYIPTANVKSFVAGGTTAKEEDLANWPIKTVNGVECYCVSVELPVAESLGDITVTVALKSGTTTVDANWTLNVINYAKSVLADTKTDDVTVASQALVKDMLVYADAAHTLFEEGYAASAKSVAVKELIAANTSSTEIPDAEAKKPADKTYFSDVEISLNDVPSFRFYLKDGYTKDDFTFKVGERSVDALLVESIDGTGDYLEIVMYAYMMLDTVSYTVVDKTTGQSVTEYYNLYSYHNYISELAEKNPEETTYVSIKALVEGLMKYSVSAAEYRNAVIGA